MRNGVSEERMWLLDMINLKLVVAFMASRWSKSNPFGRHGLTNHGGSMWNEEEWIRKYGPDHHL